MGHVVGGADRLHIAIHPIEQRNHRHLPGHRDRHALVSQRPQRLDRQGQVLGVGDVVLPELPGQALVGIHRIEHPIDRVLGHGMAEHAGHLFLGRDHGGGATALNLVQVVRSGPDPEDL